MRHPPVGWTPLRVTTGTMEPGDVGICIPSDRVYRQFVDRWVDGSQCNSLRIALEIETRSNLRSLRTMRAAAFKTYTDNSVINIIIVVILSFCCCIWNVEKHCAVQVDGRLFSVTPCVIILRNLRYCAYQRLVTLRGGDSYDEYVMMMIMMM